MSQDNISTLAIFVEAQVGGAIKDLSALEKAAAKLGPAFERSLKETTQSVDVFDAKLNKISRGFTQGNYGAAVQKQVDQIRAYYSGLQADISSMKLKDPQFDSTSFEAEINRRKSLLNSYQLMLDKFGAKPASTGAGTGVIKNSEADKEQRWLAIAQSKQERAAAEQRQQQRIADDRRQAEAIAQDKQSRRLETARRLDARIAQDYFESGIGTGKGERKRQDNERALAARIADEKAAKQQRRLETARGLDEQIARDEYRLGIGDGSGERKRRENEKAVAATIASEKQQRRIDAARRLDSTIQDDYDRLGIGQNKSNRLANEAAIQQSIEERNQRGREAGSLDAIRMRQREAAFGVGGNRNRIDALTDPLFALRPGDDPRLNTKLGLAQNEHLVNRPTNQPIFAADTERKEVVSNFKLKLDKLDTSQLQKLQTKLQNAIKITDPADEQRLKRYGQLLGEVDKKMMMVQGKAKPLTFTNERELTKYVRGLSKLEQKLSRAEHEGQDVAVALKRVRQELVAINNTPMKSLVPSGTGMPGGRGKNGLRMGANSETRNFRFVSQQLAFGADDFMQTYQLGGLKSGMRAMSNNLTAIAGLAIPNPAVAAGAVVGISAMSATLPPLVDWLTALSTGIPDLEAVKGHLERISTLASIDAKIKILVDDEDLDGLTAYIKKLEQEQIVLKIKSEYTVEQFNEFNKNANKIKEDAGGAIPSTFEAAQADVLGTLGGAYNYVVGDAFGDDAEMKQYVKDMEEIANTRKEYLEAQANRDALRPEIDKSYKNLDDIKDRIDYAKPTQQELKKTDDTLNRSDKTFEGDRKRFLESLGNQNERIRKSLEKPDAGDQAATTKEATNELKAFKDTVASVTPTLQRLGDTVPSDTTTKTITGADEAIPLTTSFSDVASVPTHVPETEEVTKPIADEAIPLSTSFSGMASVPMPQMPSPEEVAKTREAAKQFKINERNSRVQENYTADRANKIEDQKDFAAEMHALSQKSKMAYARGEKDFGFDYEAGATPDSRGRYSVYAEGKRTSGMGDEIEQIAAKTLRDVKERNAARRLKEEEAKLVRNNRLIKMPKPDNGLQGGFSSVQRLTKDKPFIAGDGASLTKVGTPLFDDPVRAVSGTFEPLKLPDTVAEFTRKIDEFYEGHLERKEQEIRMNNPGIRQSAVDKRMEPERIKVEEDREQAINDYSQTFDVAQKRIETEKAAADQLRSSLLATVEPRRKLEEDFLKRQKSILGNRAISNKERGNLLELSKRAFEMNAAAMDKQQPKPINNGVDVGSRADAELKQRLMGYADTKSIGIQQIIADNTAKLITATEKTNTLMKKNKVTGAKI